MDYLGIDIGGTAVKYGIVTRDGKIRAKAEYPVAFDFYQTPILETVLSTSQLFLKRSGIELDSLQGIGISATGQIDTMRGVVVGVGGNITNWEGADIKQALERKYQRVVTVVNDANCVALGEKWIGAAKDYKNVIVITIGTGVGGGIIINDKLLLGAAGLAGEIGHFSINKNGRLCTCGNRGCLEQYASMTALIRRVKESFQVQGMECQELTGKRIFEMAADKDELILKLIDDWIEDIASGLVSLTHIFNPEMIVIGGGVSVQEELFISRLRKLVKSRAMRNFGSELQLEKAKLGNYAGIVGAVRFNMLSAV